MKLLNFIKFALITLHATNCFAGAGDNCYSIQNQDSRNFCLATAKQNKNHCYSITSMDQKNMCLALASNDKNHCHTIRNRDTKNHCLGQL